MTSYWTADMPIQLEAICTRSQAEALLPFDHHRVLVVGCWGILLTYQWLPLAAVHPPFRARVIFNPAPYRALSEAEVRRIIRAHPEAPAAVQAVLKQLTFHERAR